MPRLQQVYERRNIQPAPPVVSKGEVQGDTQGEHNNPDSHFLPQPVSLPLPALLSSAQNLPQSLQTLQESLHDRLPVHKDLLLRRPRS